MKKSTLIRLGTVLMAIVLCICCMTATFTCEAAASQQVILTIDNSGGDDNPFLRFFPNNKVYGSGGPFTVSMELKLEGWKRMSGHADDGDSFVNCLFMDISGCQMHQKGNRDWFTVSFKFDNIKKVLIDGELRDYGLIDVGLYYIKAKMSVRNFKITNAAGKVMYSIDTDPDIAKCDDIRDIGEINPEPMVVQASFGASGSCNYPVTKVKTETSSTVTSKETSKPTSTVTSKETSKPTSSVTSKVEPGKSVVSGTSTDPVEGDESVDETDESQTEEPTDVSDEISEEPGEESTEPGEESTETEVSKPTGGKKIVKRVNTTALIILIAVGVLVAVAIVLLIILLLKKKKTSDSEEETPSSEE